MSLSSWMIRMFSIEAQTEHEGLLPHPSYGTVKVKLRPDLSPFT